MNIARITDITQERSDYDCCYDRALSLTDALDQIQNAFIESIDWYFAVVTWPSHDTAVLDQLAEIARQKGFEVIPTGDHTWTATLYIPDAVDIDGAPARFTCTAEIQPAHVQRSERCSVSFVCFGPGRTVRSDLTRQTKRALKPDCPLQAQD